MDAAIAGDTTGDDSEATAVRMNKKSKDMDAVQIRRHQILSEDSIDPKAELVYELHTMDVAFGRGRGYQNHPGNKRMRDIIEKYKTQYQSSKRGGKRTLVQTVYDEISEGGIRFLRKLEDKDFWVIVNRPIVLQRVTHTLRCRKSAKKLLLGGDGNVPQAASRPPTKASTQRINPAPTGAATGAAGSPVDNGAMPNIAGLNTLATTLPPSAVATMGTSLAVLEAQRMVALERYRAFVGIRHTMPESMSYYESAKSN